MNLPNLLTLLRIFFVPLLVAALVMDPRDLPWKFFGLPDFPKEFFALTIFLAAAATDLLDGYLARKWGQITTVGTLLDPIADKLLISAALISLVQVGEAPGWVVILIIGRDFAIGGLRSIAAAEGYTIQASDLGKTKMITQVLSVALILAGLHWPEVRFWGSLALYGSALFALASAFDYFRKFWRKIDERVKLRRRRELLGMERRKRKLSLAKRREERLAKKASKLAAPSSSTPGS